MSNAPSTQPPGSRKSNDLSSKMPSSHGDSPRVETPREITPDDASWSDRTEREISADDDETRTDALLDEAIDLSFPASDPIAIPSSPTERDKVKQHARDKDEQAREKANKQEDKQESGSDKAP